MRAFLTMTLAALGCCMTGPLSAAGSVDGSLDEIAGQIVERTQSSDHTAGEPPTIGISTFTHGDGTCSDLSNYITEFVVDSLFNAGNGQINIIERSQLSAIFREMELVYDGTIAPDAAKRLGEIEGVDAVVTGSLIQFGEQVKLQARLISTENGRLFATARSSFPSVGSVAKMMASRSRAQCGFTGAAGATSEGGGTEVVVVDSSGSAQATQQSAGLAAPSRNFSSDVFDAEVSSLIYSKAKGLTSFSVRFKNTSDNEIAMSHVSESLSVSDGLGGFLTYKDKWSGIRGCGRSSSFYHCTASSPHKVTTIAPGKVAQLNFRMEGEKDQDAPKLSLTFEFVVTLNTEEADTYEVEVIGFYDMTPDMK